MLEEKSIIDLVEVRADGILQVRRRDQILKDGVEISASFHRHCTCPGDDLTSQDQRVKDIANAIWKPELLAEYATAKAAREAAATAITKE